MNYDWVVVAPDVQDLQLYSRARRNLSVTHYGRKAGNPADAGLRVIARFSKYVEQLVSDQIEASVKTLEQVGERRIRCEVFQLGNTDWSPKQKVRSSFHRLRPTKATIAGYEILDRHMPNNFRRQKDSDVGFLMVPRPRPRIARNLIDGTYWYKDLFDVPDVLREQVQERSEQGDSLKSTWFDLLSFERNSLRNIMDDMTAVDEQSEEVDQIFVKAFHQALKKSYGREAARAEEGSRDWTDRIDDFRQATRRDLMKANTRKLLRETLTEFFSRAGPNRFLQEHADQIWDFIDHDRDWRRARDLALLSLVTYQAEDREELEEVVQEEVSE
jgi:CRISPR-associated protein Cas8a1/Csx13